MKKKQPFSTIIPFTDAGLSIADLKIVYRPIKELRPASRNARQHPERQLVQLAASIRRYGFLVAVLITPGGEIISGEARVEAAHRAGLSKVPTVCLDHLTDEQVEQVRVAENQIHDLSSFNQKKLGTILADIIDVEPGAIEAMGFVNAEIDVLIDIATDAEPAADPVDTIPEPPVVPAARSGDLWCLGEHRLLCESSLDTAVWERLMAGQTAAMSFVDFPYNVKISGNVCGLGKVKHSEFAMASGEMSEAEFTGFLTNAMQAARPHLAEGAIMAACMDWRHLFEILTAARAAAFDLINLCVWNKTNGGLGSLYRSKHELVLILKKPGAPHINNVELGKHGRYRTNVWDYAGANSFSKTRDADLASHPTCKPVACVADAIRDVSRHGDIVVDGFMGSGTTILAAERTKRVAYGIEIEPKYIDVAIRRWEKMTGKSAVLEATGETFAGVAAARATATAIPDAA